MSTLTIFEQLCREERTAWQKSRSVKTEASM